MKFITQEDLDGLSDESQDHLIRLNCFTKDLVSLWFWEKWFDTKKYKESLLALAKVLRESSVYIEFDFMQGGKLTEDKNKLKEFWDECAKVYGKWGGK